MRSTLLLLLLLLPGCAQSPAGLVREADSQLSSGDYQGAMKLYRRAYDLDPKDPLVRRRVEQMGTLSGIRAPRAQKPAIPRR